MTVYLLARAETMNIHGTENADFKQDMFAAKG